MRRPVTIYTPATCAGFELAPETIRDATADYLAGRPFGLTQPDGAVYYFTPGPGVVMLVHPEER